MQRIALACLALVFSSTGCSQLKSYLKDVDKPSARITNVKLNNLSLDGVGILVDVKITNPYAVALPLVNLDYKLATNGTPFLNGAADVQGSIPAKDSKTIQVPATISFSGLLENVKTVRPGSVVPYKLDVGLGVDAPVVGRLNLPISKTGEFPVPSLPKIELAGIDWTKLSLQDAQAVLKIKVNNTNSFPIDLSKLDYGLSLGGKRIGGASVSKATHFGKGQSNTLSIPISVKPIDLGLSAFRMLSGKGSSYELGGSLGVKTPFGPLTMPFNKSGSTKFTK